MSPDEVMNNIDHYVKKGRGGYPGEAADRQAFREGQWDETYSKALDLFRQDPATAANARTLAKKAADEAYSVNDALHKKEMPAGGKPVATDLGDFGVNSSLGSQWAKTKSGSTLSRVQQLRKAAERAKQAGKSLMEVVLKEC